MSPRCGTRQKTSRRELLRQRSTPHPPAITNSSTAADEWQSRRYLTVQRAGKPFQENVTRERCERKRPKEVCFGNRPRPATRVHVYRATDSHLGTRRDRGGGYGLRNFDSSETVHVPRAPTYTGSFRQWLGNTC